MKENLVETIELSNGLNLEIIDISRDIAEDTCLVSIIFRIPIKIEKEIFKNNTDPSDYKNVKDKLGDEIKYEAKHERNFIEKDLKETVFAEIKESFLKTNLKYLSHENFAEKYVMRQFIN